MDYYGLLFLYYLKGLSGKSILRLFFNIEAGGTEQLLPENTSTPTTTPILADIQYPDGLRTDQYFTYRETPTTVSNKARIKTIKGNTVDWNQLFNSMETKTTDGITTSYDSTTHLVSITNDSRTSNYSSGSMRGNLNFNFIKGHKYLAKSNKDVLGVALCEALGVYYPLNTIFTVGADVTPAFWRVTNQYDFVNTHPVGDVTSFYLNVFDLTLMGLDSITEPSELTSIFSLPYYDYNAGTLLSFNGTGIKAVGKNLLKNVATSTTVNGITYTINEDGSITINGTATSNASIQMNNDVKLPKGIFKAVCNGDKTFGTEVWWFVYNFTQAKDMASQQTSGVFEYNGSDTLSFRMFVRSGNTINNLTIYPMIIFNGTDETFEPYTSHTTNLPIATYFPTGMKSAGTVYDELTPRKAITRIGAVDLGTLNWRRLAISEGYAFVSDEITNIKPLGNVTTANVLCSSYTLYMRDNGYSMPNDKTYRVGGSYFGTRRVIIRDDSYTDATAFKTAMSGVYLYYELATPTETPITTEDANEALSLLMGKSVSSSNAKQMIDIITKGE